MFVARWRDVVVAVALLLCADVIADETTTPSNSDPHLTTDDESFLTVIQGFATQLQCVLNTCSNDVVWYKDDVQIFAGTKFLNSSKLDQKAYKLQHSVDVNYEKGCSGECDDSKPCADGFACVDNQCCSCRREDFTLVLRNLTFEDSGRYKCQLGNKSELLEFQVEVLESGLKGGFHENISYDHSECCVEKGISPLCRGMCKPSEMDKFHFDPTSCKTDDYKHFLSCATEGGTRSHVHCCKTQLVPSFCYDFCSGDFQMLRRSHRLCLYYLPEIFSCLDRAYLPFPDPPRSIIVNPVEHDKLSVCWQEPEQHESNKMFPVLDYSVYYKEIPNFPLLGGEVGLPLLTGDYSDIPDMQEDEYQQEEDDPTGGKEAKDRKKRSTDLEDLELFDSNPSIASELSTSGVSSVAVRREKRSTMVIVTRDDASNSTTVREFSFHSVNTTQKCVTLSDLRSATKYIVYVTARNEYGTSVPSVRSIASTNVHLVKNNESIPDAMKCCTSANVTLFCAAKMCNVVEDPSAFATISIATTCRAEWPKVSPCIADGRNHTDCCRRKGVQSDCLNICSGSTKELGVHSVLCLNLDLQAIYQCLREGYELHPSAPMNVTVSAIKDSSAVIKWSEPTTNSHLVMNYTIFLRRNEHGAPIREVKNAISPHTELGLHADSEYVVTVQSHGPNGTSLPSTAVLFMTNPSLAGPLCTVGEPIYLSDGRPLTCDSLSPCPTGYRCSGIDSDLSFCCPNDDGHSDANFQACCKEQKMPTNCLSNCFYNTTLSEECKPNLNTWVQCGSDGHDHLRCCMQRNVSKDCLDACKHPFTVDDKCFAEVPTLHSCYAGPHINLPQAIRALEVTSITHDSATLTWEDIEDHIINFRVELYSNGTLIKTDNSTADIYRFSDLTPETIYQTRVIAMNSHGEGPPSFMQNFTTKPTHVIDGDKPCAPDGLKVAWNLGPRVNVTWNKVAKKLNDETINSIVEYTVYYLDTEKNNEWTTIKTNESWVVIRDLREDALYYVYATATSREDAKTSKTSSIITLLASPNILGLPEPRITISPDHRDGVYAPGDKLTIECSLPVDSKKVGDHLNIDLSFGQHVVQNDHGSTTVRLDVEADASMDTATCAASDTDGRQHVAMRHLTLSKVPSVKMSKEKMRVLDDQTVEMECVFRGAVDPTVHFEKDGQRTTKGSMTVKKTEAGYVAKLHFRKVKTSDAGVYKCVVESGGVTVEDKAELIITTEVLPVNPKLILSCCEDEGITGPCLQACSIGKIPPNLIGNCSEHAASLLKCAADVRDHSDCCIASGVTKKCLPLCSGDSFSTDVDCSSSAVSIMSCFVKGHEHAPIAVTGLNIKSNGKGTVKVDWSYPPTSDYKYFAVYYRKKDEDDWQMEKSLQTSVELSLDASSEYEVGVIVANALGHSPFVFADIPVGKNASERKPSSSDSSSGFWIFFILAFCGIAVAVLVVMGRRRELPSPFGKFVRRRNDANLPTVAFENPAYVSGNEVEIRGLGSSSRNNGEVEWQSHDLQAGDNSHEYRNGSRYAKLET